MKYKVIVPSDVVPLPEKHEISAAMLLTKHFKSDVIFIKRTNNYTPDVSINGIKWEIKSPTGKGKHNIQHNLQEAAKQSRNVVLDARRSKIHQVKFNAEAKHQFEIIRGIKRLIIIEKSGKIIDIA
jgi:hypothetical protein